MMIVLFASFLSLAFLLAPAILEARGGKGGRGGGRGGGHHGGYHGGHRGGSPGGHHYGFHGGYRECHSGGDYRGYQGGSYGGSRYYGGVMLGFGGAYYIAPWGWQYPGDYPEYYYGDPPAVYDQPPAIDETLPPGFVEPPSDTQDFSPGDPLSPPTTGQIRPNSSQRRCQKQAPIGEFYSQPRWDPKKKIIEIVSLPNFVGADYPGD
jgi:hypothetical protein